MSVDLCNAALFSVVVDSATDAHVVSQPLLMLAGSFGHLAALAGLAAVGISVWHLRRSARLAEARRREEARLRAELTGYLLLDVCPRTGSRGELGRHIPRVIASRSAFSRAALLLRDHAGELVVAGSTGMDDISVKALNRWGRAAGQSAYLPGAPERAEDDGTDARAEAFLAGHTRVGAASFSLRLERRAPGGSERDSFSTMSCRDVVLLPMRTAAGLIGAIAVSAERSALPPEFSDEELGFTLAQRLEPLEALTLRLTLQVGADAGKAEPRAVVARQPRRRFLPQAAELPVVTLGSRDPEVRRALDVAAVPLSSGPISPARLLEMVGHPPIARLTEGVSGRPSARLWG